MCWKTSQRAEVGMTVTETGRSVRITGSLISKGMPQQTQLPLGAAASAADICSDRPADAETPALPMNGRGLKWGEEGPS